MSKPLIIFDCDGVLVDSEPLAAIAYERVYNKHGLALTRDVTAAIRAARAQIPHTMHLEVEVDDLSQIEPVLAGGVDTIMLDNFTLDDLRTGVELVAGRAIVEASGGVRLDTIGAIAETGVDVISVGALTHGVRALDLGLDLRIEGG